MATTPAIEMPKVPGLTSGLIGSPGLDATKVAVDPNAPVGAAAVTPTLAPVTTRTVQDNETVAGQMGQLMSKDSPWLQAARNRGNEAAAKRGLINSSLGVQASEEAALNAALPIAQQDAQTYGNAANANMSAMNTMASSNADSVNKAALANMDASTKYSLATIEANYKTLMQANASAGALYQDVVKNITSVLTNKDMDAKAKQAAVDNQIQMLQAGMGLFGSMNGLNLAGLLDFSNLPTTTPAPKTGAGTGSTDAAADPAAGTALTPGNVVIPFSA